MVILEDGRSLGRGVFLRGVRLAVWAEKRKGRGRYLYFGGYGIGEENGVLMWKGWYF